MHIKHPFHRRFTFGFVPASSQALNVADLINVMRFSDRMSYYDSVRDGRRPPTMGTLEAIYS